MTENLCKGLQMSDDEQPDFHAYISYHVMGTSSYSLFMGFTFTSMIVLLTWVSDPSELKVQITLFALAVLFHALAYLLFIEEAVVAYSVRIAPRLPEGYSGVIVRYMSDFVWYMLAGITLLIFSVWELFILAAASGVVGISLVVLATLKARPLYRAIGEKWTRE
jgi:hypothetical protein